MNLDGQKGLAGWLTCRFNCGSVELFLSTKGLVDEPSQIFIKLRRDVESFNEKKRSRV